MSQVWNQSRNQLRICRFIGAIEFRRRPILPRNNITRGLVPRLRGNLVCPVRIWLRETSFPCKLSLCLKPFQRIHFFWWRFRSHCTQSFFTPLRRPAFRFGSLPFPV